VAEERIGFSAEEIEKFSVHGAGSVPEKTAAWQ
jgi:hypothetical protein